MSMEDVMREPSPIEIARELFRKHSQLLEGVTLEERLAEYSHAKGGFVIATPVLFAMGAIVTLDPDTKAWFVDTAVGGLSELLKMVPFHLPFIVFKRMAKKNNGHVFRVIPVTRLFNLSQYSQHHRMVLGCHYGARDVLINTQTKEHMNGVINGARKGVHP